MDYLVEENLPDRPLPGFRLSKLEIYNWGTFDGKVYSVQPRGKTTLVVGENGSGKSTLVDALLTLLVRPQTRNYNVAAGAQKNERDERTYIRGAYDRTIGPDGPTADSISTKRAWSLFRVVGLFYQSGVRIILHPGSGASLR